MKLTPEQLLQPRYEVIADYPNSPFKVGEILELRQYELTNGHKYYGHERANAGGIWDENYLNQYPRLFRRLEWQERREISELPKFVKKADRVLKVTEWDKDTDRDVYFTYEGAEPSNIGYYVRHDVLPATLQDYTDYLTKTK